jgi:hypothetical protein
MVHCCCWHRTLGECLALTCRGPQEGLILHEFVEALTAVRGDEADPMAGNRTEGGAIKSGMLGVTRPCVVLAAAAGPVTLAALGSFSAALEAS